MSAEYMSDPILKVKGLVRHFGQVKAVDGISFELERGQVVGFIGANGAGKTTTMRLLTTLDLPDSGEVEYDGIDAIEYPEKVKSRIGWMPDGFDPVDGTTVQDYVDFFARAYGLTGQQRVEEVARVLEFCGITELKNRYINKLSKGQTQRLSLARMLIGNPDFLVMDEPAAGLDPQARLEFKQLVRSLVLGPIANDKLSLQFRLFDKGIISLDDFVDGLKFRQVYMQYSFHTNRAVELLELGEVKDVG